MKHVANVVAVSALCLAGAHLRAQSAIDLKPSVTAPPTTYHQVALAANFSNANAGTVDLFAKGAKDEVSIPSNYVGSQDADNSDSYFGLITYIEETSLSIPVMVSSGFQEFTDKSHETYSEYLQAPLPSALAAGKEYEITFKVSLADNSAFATGGWGVLFSDQPLSMPTNQRINSTPTVSMPDVVKDKNGWTELKAKFKATGNEKYLVIGCFGNGFKEEETGQGKGFGKTKAYYYLSSISMKESIQDRDKDGIVDKEDKCPDVFGVASLQGCPDSDGDGITDADDKCPSVAGPASLRGCPDKDGDGIADIDDKCPAVAGIAALNGCPEMKVNERAKQVFQKAMRGIQFESGKDVIKKTSYPVLDNVATVLKENPSWNVAIEGHTDNVGKAESNKVLSEKRAIAVKNYLVGKGIDSGHLAPAGYGQERPVADNKTPAGRTQNRRVEFKVTYEE